MSSFCRGRRRGRPCRNGRQPCLLICWILITSLALVFAGDGGEGVQLTYVWGERTLQLKCPRSQELLSSVLIQRKPGRNDTQLAGWDYTKPRGYSRSYGERVTVDNSYDNQLVANISHVTCFDNAQYLCRNFENSGSSAVPHTYEAEFIYPEDVSRPVISQWPLAARYKARDILQLNCSASIGPSADNAIIWEVKRKNESHFTPVNKVTFPHAMVSSEMPTRTGECRLQSTRELQYILSAADDEAHIQCRLQKTGNSSHIIVVMQCPDAATDGDNDRTSPRTISIASTARREASPRDGQNTDSPKIEYLKEEEGAKAKEDKFSSGQLVAILVCTMGVVFAGLVVMALILKRRYKRQPSPLVLMDTSASSENRENEYFGRQLPHMPHLTMLDHQRGQFGPSPTTLSSLRYVDTPLLSSIVHSSTLPDKDSDLSIYVSMTGLDTLQSAQDKGSPENGPGLMKPLKVDASLATSEYHNDSLGRDRSESLYSNQIQVQHVPHCPANDHVDDETRLKTVD